MQFKVSHLMEQHQNLARNQRDNLQLKISLRSSVTIPHGACDL